MTTDRDRILSEFIDSWNAGRRPDIDDHVARVPEAERDGLLSDITNYISWAPTPDFDEPAMDAIRAEPAVVAALATWERAPQSWAHILAARRKALSLSTAELASRLVALLDLSAKREAKAQAYLEQAERGELDTSRFAPRLTAALAELLGVSRADLSGLASTPLPPAAAPAFRATEDAAKYVRDDLEVLADMAAAPAERDWDEVDDLFRGG